MQVSDLIDSQGVADVLGVKLETVYRYKARGILPLPELEPRGPLWSVKKIEKWDERRRKHAGSIDEE